MAFKSQEFELLDKKEKGDLIMKGRVKKGKDQVGNGQEKQVMLQKMGCRCLETGGRHESSGEVKGSIVSIVQI